MTDPQWGGDERRSIPIHVLNYVKEIVQNETAIIKDQISGYRDDFVHHDQAEGHRYDQIIENQDKAERRYNELIRSFEAYSDKAEDLHEDVKKAFLVNRYGKPDFEGHANAHESWIKQAESNRKLLADIRTAVVIALAIGVGGWLLNLGWGGFLLGPR